MVMGYQAYAGNGLLDGITTGVGLRKAYDDMKRQQQLQERSDNFGTALSNYYSAQDDAGRQAALQEMAKNDPASTVKFSNDIWNQQHKNDITPFQREQLAIQRKQLEQNAVPTSIRELQYVNEHPEMKDIYLQSKRGTNIYNNLNPLDKKRIENIASNIDKNIAESTDKLALYDRADQLLDKVSTGWLGFGRQIQPEFMMGADEAEFNSLVNKLAPQQRPAGAGTTSDKDMEIYKKSTIGWGKSKEANKSIVALGKAMAQNDIAHEELRAEWIGNNLGSLTEFDKLWRKYANEQRIYNDDGSINKNRVDPYEWFSAAMSGNVPSKQEPQYKEGQTATNPKTGEKLIYQNGQWRKA